MMMKKHKILDHKLRGVTFRPSPNQSGDIFPEYIIIHDTASRTEEGAISWMLNRESRVSAHVHIARNGNIVQLVEFNKRAYHAGVSNYAGRSDFNWWSIGIELQNTGLEDYPEVQMERLIGVCRALFKAYPTIKMILGHRDISPDRKVDPNDFFPMERVRKEVFG